MASLRALMAISAAVMTLAGSVLVAAGTLTGWRDGLAPILGGFLGTIGFVLWYREYRKADLIGQDERADRVVRDAVEEHRRARQAGGEPETGGERADE